MKAIRFSLNAPYTLGFSALSVFALLAGVVSDHWTTMNIFSVGDDMSFTNPLSYIRVFCHVLGHQDPSHLVYNLSFLLLLGPMLEEKHGIFKLFVVTLVTAGMTALPMLLLPGNLLGASGGSSSPSSSCRATPVRPQGRFPSRSRSSPSSFLGAKSTWDLVQRIPSLNLPIFSAEASEAFSPFVGNRAPA